MLVQGPPGVFWRLSHWQTSVTTETTRLSHWRSFRFSVCHKACGKARHSVYVWTAAILTQLICHTILQYYSDHVELNILINNLLQIERLSCHFTFFSPSLFPLYSYNSNWYWTQSKEINIFHMISNLDRRKCLLYPHGKYRLKNHSKGL